MNMFCRRCPDCHGCHTHDPHSRVWCGRRPNLPGGKAAKADAREAQQRRAAGR